MEPCSKPKPGPYKREQEFKVSSTGVAESYELTTLGWMIATALTISAESEESESGKIPGWAGYKSLVSSGQPLTRVGALPLLPEVAHEWSTMLTVMELGSWSRPSNCHNFRHGTVREGGTVARCKTQLEK